MKFIPIRIKTYYSFMKSTISIDKLIAFAIENKLPCISIVDDNLMGVYELIDKCNKHHIPCMVGLETTLEDNKLIALARNNNDYESLINLFTTSTEKTLEFKDLPTNLTYIISKYDERFNLFNTFIEYTGGEIYSNSIYVPLISSLSEEDSVYLNYLSALKRNCALDSFEKKNYYHNKLDDIPLIALENTFKIIENANIIIPKFENLLPVYREDFDSDSYLTKLAYKGLSLRLNCSIEDLPIKYKQQLNKELNVILGMNFADYFLIVTDFIKYAKKEGILVGIGRGSAGASLVAYSLGITEFDPLLYNLYFERFLNSKRSTMPDIDTDFPDIYREQVINYVTERYGFNKVCGISTISTMQTRQLFRDLGKVLSIDKSYIDRLLKLLGELKNIELKEIYKDENIYRYINSNKNLKELYCLALYFEGFPSHYSTHAAGIIISRQNLRKKIPLIKQDNGYLSAFSMKELKKLGFLKMDFLGIKNLTTITKVLEDIKTTYQVSLNFKDIPLDDPETFKLFARGDTSAIFQFESQGMRKLLKDLKVDSINDLIDAIALFRPGPQAFIKNYIDRKFGKEKIEYLDPSLEPILNSTKGIIIYQEQVLAIAHIFAGMDLKSADLFRVAISNKDNEKLKEVGKLFIQSSIENGKSSVIAEKLLSQLINFANYGFNKSHSVAYAITAYRMAYLKTHYPLSFYREILNCDINDKNKLSLYIKEARLSGLKITAPKIFAATKSFKTINDKLYYPLIGIKNIGYREAEKLENIQRVKDLYELFKEFKKNNINKSVIESLIKSGCLADFGNRKTLMFNLKSLMSFAELNSDGLFITERPLIKQEEEYSKEELLLFEKEYFGIYLNMSPCSIYKSQYPSIDLKKLRQYISKEVDILVLINKKKEIITKNGQKMAFYTGSDDEDVDMVAFNTVYKNLQLNKNDIALIRGTVEYRDLKVQLVIKKAIKLGTI